MSTTAAAPTTAAPAATAGKGTKVGTKKTAPAATASHPKYSEMVQQALASLKERGGSSRQAVLKYIMAHFKVGTDENMVNTHLKMALKAGIKNGSLKQSKGKGAAGSFRIGEQAKKAPKPAKAKTAEKKKKAAVVKTAESKKPAKTAAVKKATAAKPKTAAKKPSAKKPAAAAEKKKMPATTTAKKSPAPKAAPAAKKTAAATKKSPVKKASSKKTVVAKPPKVKA